MSLDLQVTLLGTGSPIPDPNRAGPSTLVRAGGAAFLVDAGRGVLMRLMAAGVLPGMLDTVLLTHLHSDHTTDFNDVVTTRWAMSPVPNPLRVVGPVGTQRFVDRTLEMLTDDIGWRIAHHDDLTAPPQVDVVEIDAGAAEDGALVPVLERDGLRVLAGATEHRPVHPTLGYRFEVERGAAALAGDTIPCAGLDAICRSAAVYVQTVIRRAGIESIPSARLQDVLDYHSTLEQAGDTALRCGVRTLVLTHMVPAVMPGFEQMWIDDTRAGGFGGEVLLGHDLLSVEV